MKAHRLLTALLSPVLLAGVRRGPSCTADSGVTIAQRNLVTMGAGVTLRRGVVIKPYGGFVTLGSNVSVNEYCILYGHGGLTIGDNVRIATHTVIVPANHVFASVEVPIYRQGLTRYGITIRDDVWIGAGVKVLDGVTIGKGSVIGAGAVVTHDIPPYSVAVGVPARVQEEREHDD